MKTFPLFFCSFMNLTKTKNWKGNKNIVLNIKGTPQEITDFECSLTNWGVCEESHFYIVDSCNACVTVSEKKLLDYFTNLEMGRFDPDRIISEKLKNFVDSRVKKRFDEIVEIETPKLYRMR